MRYAISLRVLLSGLCTIALTYGYLLLPIQTWASTTSAASGQISLARQVSINGSNAIAGQTIFSGSRVKVANQGNAVLNLGRLGRIELGANSDFALRVAGNVIGGELTAGCVTISAPASVNIELNTAKGAITSDGKSPSSFLVGVQGIAANILPTLGTVKITTGGKTEKAAAGEFLSLISDPKGGDRLLRRPATDCGGPNAMCACSTSAPRPAPASTAGKSANAAGGSSLLLPALVLAAAGGTAAVLLATTGNGGGNGLTCVGFSCRPTSPTVP
ncbi:MAG: hypothetical protein ABI977_27130 [Acidobacteriota bacterium]